jgi:carbon-monoxide dehydrogenase large subunit
VRAIDATAALAWPGVLTVLAGTDAEADGLRPIPHRPVPTNPYEVPLRSRDGSDFFLARHPALAVGTVRFVGEAVAMVIAETPAAAADAAECVVVDYEPLLAVVLARDAVSADAPLVWQEHGSNVCVDSHAGDAVATEAAFARAAHIMGLDTWVHRVPGIPMEPRTAVGDYDAATGPYTHYAGRSKSRRTNIAAVQHLGAAHGEARLAQRAPLRALGAALRIGN